MTWLSKSSYSNSEKLDYYATDFTDKTLTLGLVERGHS